MQPQDPSQNSTPPPADDNSVTQPAANGWDVPDQNAEPADDVPTSPPADGGAADDFTPPITPADTSAQNEWSAPAPGESIAPTVPPPVTQGTSPVRDGLDVPHDDEGANATTGDEASSDDAATPPQA